MNCLLAAGEDLFVDLFVILYPAQELEPSINQGAVQIGSK